MALHSLFSLYLFAYLTFYRYIAKVNEFSRVYSEIFV